MSDQMDWEAYTLGLIAGIGLILWLIRFELWLEHRPVPPAPSDPFDTLRWDVLACARRLTESSDAAG